MSPITRSVQRVVARRLPTPLKAALRHLGLRAPAPSEVELDGWELSLKGGATIVWPPAAEVWRASRQGAHGGDLRCLLVTESLDASGTDEFVAFLARRLPEERIDARVLLPADSPGWCEGRLAQQLMAEGITVWSVAEGEGAGIIAKWSPDVVYSHGAITWPLIVARDLGIPAMEALHGMLNVFDRTADELSNRRSLLDCIVAVSELVRQQYLARDTEAHADMVITIPNGINRERAVTVPRVAARHALGIGDEFLFVSLARHTLQKNTYGLASAFLEVAPTIPSAHLLICGRPDDPGYARHVLDLRDRSASGGRLHLRDNTDRIDVLLAAADAFVLDSFFEGWSLASMEALGAGVPVLLSDVGGAREQLEGGPAKGMLVANPLGDPLGVNWQSMSLARFARQQNREELIRALSAFVSGAVETASRDDIRLDSLERYSDDVCLARHASAIRDVASARTSPGPPRLSTGGLR